KGTVYLHWESREALFCAVIERELMAAIAELVDGLRADARAVALHRLIHDYYLAIMRRPVLRALFVSDSQVLGRLVRSDGTLKDRLQAAFSEWIRLLAKSGLVTGGGPVDELAYAVRAVVGGFFVHASLPAGDDELSLECKAGLLSCTLRRAFEASEEVEANWTSLAARAIELFGGIAEYYQAQLRRAFQ
ncbi:MAG: TetR/AcrR family transcriptional regulator, partial [Chloroflexi bacterium]|nr:TetR/AcrR family transcriptional regulator [Chloroflexota bacterium]